MKTQDGLNLLTALEEGAARDEESHAGILKLMRHLVPPEADSGKIGSRLWSLVERVVRCEHEAVNTDALGRAVELAIQVESSELDVLGHRIVESLRTELPEGAARPFAKTEVPCQRLVAAAEKVPDTTLRLRPETMLGSASRR